MTEDYYYNSDWKCVEQRSSGANSASHCPKKQYVYGIRGRNDLVCRDHYTHTYASSSSMTPTCSPAKERHYALNDAMGSITAITNTSGAVVERYSYTAFGQSQVMDKDFTDQSLSLYDWQSRFHGEQRDTETGFYNYGYRYYDAAVGRFINRDPIEENGGINLYGILENDAVNWWDALGLIKWSDDECIKKCRDELLKTEHGKKLIKEIKKLEDPNKGLEITVRKRNEKDNNTNAFVSENLVIYMDCKSSKYWSVDYKPEGCITRGAWVEATCDEILSHELSHARDRLKIGSQEEYRKKFSKKGTQANRKAGYPNKAEEDAVKDTNKLRKEKGKPPRTIYNKKYRNGKIHTGINGK